MESDVEMEEEIEQENENGSESQESNEYIFMDIFKGIKDINLLLKENILYNKIDTETKIIHSYLMESIKGFHKIFGNNLLSFEDALEYLEKISIPNKCVCAGVIDSIPGWRCVECSKFENAIYCSDCYKKSKHLHKGHKIYFLYASGGMCDCGDPDSLSIFCPEHTGPFVNQEQINKYISKIFPKEILDKLISFFDKLFFQFSEYFILTEKCDLFYNIFFKEKFENIGTEDLEKFEMLIKEKNDVASLKKNFCIVFQNLIHFLRLISQKNIAMLHLIANYLLKNHFERQTIKEEYTTTHKCIKIYENEINIINNEQAHICNCPFLSLLFNNWREEIKSKENENEEFLLLFPHNLLLRNATCLIYFFLYKQIFLNNNDDVLYNRHQFFLEDSTEFIARKSHLIEDSYEIFYDYLKKYIKSPKIRDEYGSFIEEKINIIKRKTRFVETDTKYFSRPKTKKVMYNKKSIIKRAIDYFCLIHNELEFKSIVPHPKFQQKEYSTTLIEIEIALYGILEGINVFMDWKKLDIVKEIFRYIINKIINQKEEGIKQLQKDEYSFHLSLYRCFGLFINFFSYNYSLNNDKCTLMKSVEYIKNNFFISKDEIEKFVQIILYDYYKLFGFLAGAQNNFFNYYEGLNNYPFIYYNDKRTLKIDFTLLKYLFSLTEKNLDLNSFLKLSNIEDVYLSFGKIFLSDLMEQEESKIENQQISEISEKEEKGENLLKILKSKSEEKSFDSNYIMQLEFLLELIIRFIKDDSSTYWSLMRFYEEMISSQIKRELFNDIRKNKSAMKDLETILKEKIIHEMAAKNNLIDLLKLKKRLDKYLLILFDENHVNKIIGELTYNKMQGETKLFYLKDNCLKYLDMNYYLSPKEKSNAQKYIMEFKKDIINIYNNYYYNPSDLTFDLFEISYEKIFLNINNLNLLVKLVEKLLICKNNNIDKLNMDSIKNSILPLILNYLSIFCMINTKSFIEFKTQNKDLLNHLSKIFSKYLLNNNKNNGIMEVDLQKNITDILKRLDYYEIIYNNIKFDLSKLNKYDYNTEYVHNLSLGIYISNEKNSKDMINENSINLDEINLKKKNAKNIKDKLKKKMKMKSQVFLEKSKTNPELIKDMDTPENNKDENLTKDEMMCFYCRNPIKLNSYEVSYGKTGLLIIDYFYINSIKSSEKKELERIMDTRNINAQLYKDINKGFNSSLDKRGHIISCGHYFHADCFKKGLKGGGIDICKVFNCPLCLKDQNLLIPPLNNFRDKYNFFKSSKILDLLPTVEMITYEEMEIENNNEKEEKLFSDIVINFFNDIFFLNIQEKNIDYRLFLEKCFEKYEIYFNFLENVFYIDGTTFHKQQQIDTIQNIILSLRFLVNTNYLSKKHIICFLKEELFLLSSGSNIVETVVSNFENMYYVNKFKQILLSLIILYDYEEIKDIFKYIIYIFLPYMSFGYYLRYIISNNYNKDIITYQHFINYINNNNESMINYFNIFLQKFYFIKILTDKNASNDNELLNSFNDLNTEKLLTLLNINTLYKILNGNEKQKNINFLEICEFLPKIFNLNDICFNLLKNNLDYNNIYNLLIANIKRSDRRVNLTKELIINFSQIKFELIHLDDNIFDWIEKNLEKKCVICSKIAKYDYICLICGNKICHTKSCNKFNEHRRYCCGNTCICIDMDDMKIMIFSYLNSKTLFPIYVNKNGVGPNGYEIGDEYKLSKEKMKLALKNFICNDFNVN